MLNQKIQKPSFRFEIDNFSKKESAIQSQTFLNGGCQWYLYVHPKGNRLAENHRLSLYLYVANIKSLQTGWKRSADFYFRVLDQSGIELYTSPLADAENNLFCAKSAGRVFEKTLPVRKLEEKGFLKNAKLIIEVYINVVEALDGKVKEDITKKKETKTVEINGFRFLASQVTLVRKIFEEHPDIVEDLKPKNQVVKTKYMNVLLNLIDTLDKPSKKHSETELSNAQSELCELIEQGFKLDWLRSKLEKVSLNRKKVDDDGSLVKLFEKRLKNLELMELGSLKSKLEGLSLETKKACDVDRSRVQQLEERFKNLELMESGFKMEKSKIARVYLEMKKATADGSLVQKLEERLKNLELMVSNLKVEVDKKKDQSCDDEFLLVDEVD